VQHTTFAEFEERMMAEYKIFNVTYGGMECSWRSLCEYSAFP